MADSSGLLGHHVARCGVVAARANSKALRPCPAIVSSFGDNDNNEALREARPLARRAMLAGSCRFVAKAAFDADARHRQNRLTHSEQGGHSQCLGGQDSEAPRGGREHFAEPALAAGSRRTGRDAQASCRPDHHRAASGEVGKA